MDAEVQRFGRTERWLHWVHTTAFAIMFATGAILYAPPLSRIFANRPVVKGIHVFCAAGWLTALVLVVVLGNRKALGRTRAEIERFDAEDALFLRRRPSRPGRFNGGQKLHAIAHAALLVLFFVSGALLLLGEHDHALRLSGTLALHDFLTLVGAILVIGHLFKASGVAGSTSGITRGTVTAAYAAEHHPSWDPPHVVPLGRTTLTLGTVLLAAAVAAVGLAAAIALVF